jgi:hypothetical protein
VRIEVIRKSTIGSSANGHKRALGILRLTG